METVTTNSLLDVWVKRNISLTKSHFQKLIEINGNIKNQQMPRMYAINSKCTTSEMLPNNVHYF